MSWPHLAFLIQWLVNFNQIMSQKGHIKNYSYLWFISHTGNERSRQEHCIVGYAILHSMLCLFILTNVGKVFYAWNCIFCSVHNITMHSSENSISSVPFRTSPTAFTTRFIHSYIFLCHTGQNVRPLNKREYILDIATEAEQIDTNYSFWFRRVIWAHPLKFDNELCVTMHYNQARHDCLIICHYSHAS